MIARACLLLVLGCASARAGTWSDLWLTPEQQGQHELEAGRAREAAKLFTDPRRRGYAELEAKDYGAAEKQLASLADAESQYNRGNALARAGNLRSALDAYDASLKHEEAEAGLRRDARHNRDLVAKQLEQQNRQQQGGQGSGSQGDKHPKDQPGQDRQGQNQSGQDQSKQDQSKQDQSKQDHQDQSQQAERNQESDSKQSAESNAGNQGQSSKVDESRGAGTRQDGQQQAQGPGGQGQDQDAAAKAKTDAQQAERDAAQALDQARQSARNQAGKTGADKPPGGDADKGRAQAEPAAPPTEQTLALDQWLRQIPDDPGGLLRRKFLIEHMIKQNAGGSP
jgi:Ca-activated chloride channel homolog